MLFGKFVIQCEKCKKVILRDNKNTKRPEQLMVVDSDTGEPIVLPNVHCKHCKHLNLITEKSITKTEALAPKEKAKLNEKIKDDILN